MKTAILVACVLVAVSAAWLPAWGKDPTLPALRRQLMFAQEDLQVGQALDALTEPFDHRDELFVA